MKKMRAAVVGVGYLGRFHAQKYKALPQVELVGVFDANISRAEEVAAELQVAVIRELKDLVGQVDAVTVAATTSAHFEICKFLLENNIHVLLQAHF